jgi:signal transduction histidine kinase
MDPGGGSDDGASDEGRERLLIDLDGGGSAVLSVAAGTLAESPLRESVTAAIRLDAANHSLRMEIATQVDAVRASRTRLIRAADDAGRELEERLHSGADERLASLERLLAGCAADERASTFDEGLADVRALLLDAREDVDRFSAGLHPRALDEHGLAGALAIAVDESAISVDLEVAEDLGVSPDIQLAAYFFCLEGLVNIAKHASARRAWVRVASVDGELNLEVADDGAGGATPGSGIQGIADRIAALGGFSTLESEPGAGTRLIARVPLAGASASAPVGSSS